MKKLIIVVVFVLIYSMLLSAFMPGVDYKTDIGLRRFTVVNKSGHTIKWRLERVDDLKGTQWYYGEVPKGDRDFPETAVWTVSRGLYRLDIQFYEVVYQNTYDGSEGSAVKEYKLVCSIDYNSKYNAPYYDLTRNQKLTIVECDRPEPKSLGEPGMAKYWHPAYLIDVGESPEPKLWLPFNYTYILDLDE